MQQASQFDLSDDCELTTWGEINVIQHAAETEYHRQTGIKPAKKPVFGPIMWRIRECLPSLAHHMM